MPEPPDHPANDPLSDQTSNDERPLSETVYAHLRAIAQHKLAHERPGHTLQATALVHEAYMRLHRAGRTPGGSSRDFYWAAAEAMRRILIEHARSRKAVKRGGGARRLEWTTSIADVADLEMHADAEEIEALDAAIVRLENEDRRAADVVRLRFFAGLTLDEAAGALEISVRTAKRDWEFARAWLVRALQQTTEASDQAP